MNSSLPVHFGPLKVRRLYGAAASPTLICARFEDRPQNGVDYVRSVMMESLYVELKVFTAQRDWDQFHSPANLAKSITIEAGELLECFQWTDDADANRVRGELADVMTYCLLLADKMGFDPETIIREKLEVTRQKYPVNKARGRSTKYDEL